MATRLGDLVMRISAETDQFQQGASDVRRDINRVANTFKQMRTQTDKVEEEVAALVRRFKAGKISVDDYQRAMGHLNEKYRNAQIAAGGFRGQMLKLSTVITPQRAGLAALAAAGAALALAMRQVAREFSNALETMQELDPIIKGSRTINALVGDVQALSFSLGEVAGMTEERTIKALQNLARIVGQAKLEGGTAAKAFQQLGLSAAQLAAMSPTEQFNAVAKALQGIESASERARIAQQLFGREGRDIVNGLLTQAATLEEAQAAAREFGLTISQPQATAIEAANDAMGRLSAQLEGVRRQFAAELAPAVKVFATELGAVLPVGRNLTDIMRIVSASTVAAVGLLMDAINAAEALSRAIMLDFSGIRDLASDGLFANTENLLDKYEQSVRAAEEAAEADAKRAEETAKAAAAADQAAQEAERVKNAYDSQLFSLENQVTALKEGESAARRQRLEAEKFSAEQIKALEAKQQELDALKKAESDRANAQRNLDQMMKQGQRLMEQASPVAAVEKQLADLNVLLRVGAINEATFFKERNRILAENVKDLREMGAADSVQAGSAQAASMLQERMADKQNEQIAKLEEQRILQEASLGVQQRTEKAIKELRPVGTFR